MERFLEMLAVYVSRKINGRSIVEREIGEVFTDQRRIYCHKQNLLCCEYAGTDL